MNSWRFRELNQIVNCVEQTARIIFNARRVGVHPKSVASDEPHFKCDANQKTSPYLAARQCKPTVNATGNAFNIDINEIGERLAILVWTLFEYSKFVQKNQSNVFPIKFKSSTFSNVNKFEPTIDSNVMQSKSIVKEFNQFNQSDQSNQSNQSDQFNDQSPVQQQSNQNVKSIYSKYVLPKQKLNDQSKATRVPATRFGRLLSYGELAAGLGVGAVSQLTRKSLGLTTSGESVLLNEANANRIVETLCKVRGAALKIGQLLSIQDENLISPELQRIFERVRYSADFMPESQLIKMLNAQLGPDWRTHFEHFEMKPFAAASIGQVHRGVTKDGTEVAIKIQYPGVADGIDSDLKNLISVLKIWNILPRGMFIDSLVNVTRRELAWEVDYGREAQMAKQYRTLIEQHYPDQSIYVPRVYDHLSTDKVITSEMIYGLPIDKLIVNQIHPHVINDVAARLLQLCLREIFDFRLMQTDPNWSNFFYNPSTDVISLIDFGATRSYSKAFVDKYMRILKGAADKNRKQILDESIAIGFLSGYEAQLMKDAHVDSVLILGQIFHQDQAFDFGKQNISERIHKIVPVMIEHRLIPPPEEIYSLHRKISGMFMLLTKLKAQVNCKRIFDQIHAQYVFD